MSFNIFDGYNSVYNKLILSSVNSYGSRVGYFIPILE